MIGSGSNLPDLDHVMRYVPWARLRKDEHENVIGFLGAAFELNPTEDTLSLVWVDYFEGDQNKKVSDSVQMLRATRKVGAKSAFAISKVGKIKTICEENATKVRVVYAPIDGNPAHSEIRRLPKEDFALLEALATEAFVGMVKNSEVPGAS